MSSNTNNKANRKIIIPKRYSEICLGNVSNQGSRHEISVCDNVNTRVKRSHSDNNNSSVSEESPSQKKPKFILDAPHYRSPLHAASPSSSPSSTSSTPSSSSSKNIANKRLQNLRRSLEEQRSKVERQVNDRLNKVTSCNNIFNKSGNKNIFNASISEDDNKTITAKKVVSLPGTSRSSSSIGSRLSFFKSSTDLRSNNNNNSSITISNVNAIKEQKVLVNDDVQITSEIKQSSSQFRFLPANDAPFDRSVNMDDSMEWEPVDEDTVLNNVFWFGSAMFQWSFMARQLVTDINKIRKEITYDKKLPIDDVLNNSDPLNPSQNGVFIVVDTNIFLSQINILMQLRKKEFKDFNRVTIIVPWMVLQELDYMKETKGCHLGKNARKAVTYINQQLILNDPYFKGQTVLEASKQEMTSNNADDGILNCCIQLVAEKKFVILLSNDINLRNKVLVNKIQAYNSNDIMETLNKLNVPELNETYKINIDKLKLILSNLLTHIVENEMRKAYGDIWLKMVKNNPPYTMDEALNIIYKYWVSVFSFSLQKQAQHKIEEFILFSKRLTNAVTYSQESYNKFMEYSLTLCVYLKNGYPCYKFIIMDSLSNIQKCGE